MIVVLFRGDIWFGTAQVEYRMNVVRVILIPFRVLFQKYLYLLGVKENLSHTRKKRSWQLLEVLYCISDDHFRHFYMCLSLYLHPTCQQTSMGFFHTSVLQVCLVAFCSLHGISKMRVATVREKDDIKDGRRKHANRVNKLNEESRQKVRAMDVNAVIFFLFICNPNEFL